MDNPTIYHKEKRESQLVDLINLAEDISSNTETMYERKNRITLMSAISIVLSFILILFALNNTSSISHGQIFTLSFLLISISVGVIIYSFRLLYEAYKLSKEIKYEGYIIAELFTMIDGYKRIELHNSDPIKKAYIEMRLSRISFKHAKFKREAEAPQTRHTPTITRPAPSTSQTST